MRAGPLDRTQAPPVEPGDAPEGLALATFAAGCFWGVEELFRHVPGVVAAVSGYTGGHVPDPTTLNRQGPDIGTQYRSALFCHGPEQLRAAEASKAAVQPRFARPMVTEIAPASPFGPAEPSPRR